MKQKHIYLIILFLGIALALYSVYVFMVGYHNLDIGQNINLLNVKTASNFIDITSTGEQMTGTELYSYGYGLMKKAFVMFGFSLFFFGFSLSKLIRIEK